MKKLTCNKGFSLVEVMVALIVLVIMVGAFVNFFGWSITSIFADGEKTRAVAEAEKKLEHLHNSMDNYYTDTEYVNDYNDVFIKYPDRVRNFCVEEVTRLNGIVEGYNVTVVVFYHNGERHVSVSSFIEGET
ncbi:hypothetical protein SPSYN_00290 [Sporotomaculum syntrophicum]|uniref:Prepilin-type N-terminal cleavage/methylation domain-containing protein n=1 Tax=Sporotomaculum syntrophicum TaxID=182264 RepID=A0A9D2WTD6_9FIRM|nr:type II secretion system protein [Sporotomaculum syntrophicum]KAF1086571.1 hypothetical protein SPSYN_00290 [Sporotomaculum syntrophicum]